MNLPNTITLLRIAAIPLLVLAFEMNAFSPGWGLPGLFAIICTSDFIDGALARRLNQITELGKLLDPLADKILVLAGLLILLEMNATPDNLYSIPAWTVLVIMGREFAVSGLRSLAAAQGVVLAASQLGKWKTAITMFAIGFLFFRGPEPITGIDIVTVGYWMYWAALAITVWSGAEYFWLNRAFFKAEAQTESPKA